jgi:hypothetical protein
MIMSSETLHFENARLAQQLFNNDIRNLQTLEQELGVKATRARLDQAGGRGGGGRTREAIVLLLEDSVKAGTAVRNREFAHALGVVKQEGVPALKDMLSERIQTSPKKPASRRGRSARRNMWTPSGTMT